MARYSVAEAKNNLPKLLDLALQGEEVTITRRGEPIARIVPEAERRSAPGLDWFKGRRVTPRSGTEFDTAALIRRMRDEGS